MDIELSLHWSVTWCRAFPTLLTRDVYCDDNLVSCLQRVAWNELFDKDRHLESASAAATAETSRQDVDEWRDSLGYGEILPETVFCILDWIHQHHPEQNVNAVYDLGSVDGKVLLANALLLNDAQHLLGIEIVPRRHEEALQRLQEYKARVPNSNRIEFLCDDFCRFRERITGTPSSLIWIHGTVFGNELLSIVQDICDECPPQTLFVMISKPLETRKGNVETLLEARLPMSWGDGMVYVQRRL